MTDGFWTFGKKDIQDETNFNVPKEICLGQKYYTSCNQVIHDKTVHGQKYTSLQDNT